MVTSLVNGGIVSIPNGGQHVSIQASKILVNSSATAFRLTNCPVDVDIPDVLSQNDSTLLFNIVGSNATRLTSDNIDWSGRLYNITGTNQTNLNITTNTLRNITSTTSCVSNTPNVEIKANDMDLECANLITINDPSVSTTIILMFRLMLMCLT